MKSYHDLLLQQSSSARAQQVLFCELSKTNSPDLFPLHSMNCDKILISKSQDYDIFIENSFKQLKYVISTISQQDPEIAFGLQEIIDQSVRLAKIDMQKQRKYETTQTGENNSQRKVSSRNRGFRDDEKAVNKTYIGDQISRLDIESRKNSHNLTINDMPKQLTSVSSINLISGERKGKENVFGVQTSSRNSSANKKPVNFMGKMQSHIDKNSKQNISILSKTRDITTFQSNYQTAQEKESMMTLNLKPPKLMYINNQNFTYMFDQNNYLAPSREEKNSENLTLIEVCHPNKPEKLPITKAKLSRSENPAKDSIEQDFHILIKYMKLWKKYLKMLKLEKIQKKKDVNKMMKAIHYYEKMTQFNCLQALRSYTHRQEIFRNIQNQIKNRVKANLKIFYFKIYRQMFMREQKRKYMRQVAKSYFYEQRRFKCLKCWKAVTDKLAHQRETCFSEIRSKHPYAAEIILEIILGSFYIKNIEFSDKCLPDIVKFHFFALQNLDNKGVDYKRIQNMDRFNFSVEFVIQQKQARVFRCLLQNKQNLKNLKKMIRFNIKKMVFLWMKAQQYIRNEMIVLQFKRHERQIRTTFESLSLNAYGRILNRQKFEVLYYKTTKQLCKRLLLEWKQLYTYYSPFTTSQQNYSTTKQSQIQYKTPFFNKLKFYYLMRKNHKQNIYLADNKFFNRYVRICFQNWAYYHLFSNKMIRVSKATLTKKTEKQIKEKYFMALIRGYYNSIKSATKFENSLKLRVLSSLKLRIQFVVMKDQIRSICDGKRQINLLKKVLNGLKKHKNKKQQMKSLQSVLISKHVSQLQKTVISSFLKHKDSKFVKKQNIEFIDKLFLIRLKKTAFLKIHQNYWREKENLIKFEVVQEQRETYLVHKYFIEMLIKYNKRIILKQNAQIIMKQRSHKYIYKTLSIWVHRYRNISGAEHFISQKIQENMQNDIFKLWRFRYLIQKEFNFKKHLFDQKIKSRNTKVYFAAFIEQINYLANKRKLHNIGKYFCLGSKAGSCLIELKKYTIYQRLKREVPLTMQERKIEKIFKHLKWKWNRKIKLEQCCQMKNEETKEKAFQNLQKYVNLQMNNRNIIENFKSERELQAKENIFKILVCPEFYMSKEPRELEQHEEFKLKFVLNYWRKHTIKYLKLKFATDKIKNKLTNEMKKTFLKKWRTSWYIQDQIQYVAIPFFENTVEFQIKKRTFMSLADYFNRSKTKRDNFESSQNFLNQGLQIKAFESLRSQANKKIEKKLLVKYQSVKRTQRYVMQSFKCWKHINARALDLKQKGYIVRKINNFLLQQGLFKLWQSQYKEQNILKPAEQMTIELFQNNQRKKIYKALYNNRTYALVQKTMKKTSQFFNIDSTRRKAFGSLAWYGLQHKKRKNILSELSETHYKRRFINRWVEVLNKTHALKERIMTQHHETISDVQKFIGDFQDGTRTINTMNTQQSVGSLLPPKSVKAQQKIPNKITTLDLNNLNTSEDLKQAHDLLTLQLQSMMQQNSSQASQEKEILKNMISKVKLKYQSNRGLLNDGQKMHLLIKIQEQEEILSNSAVSDRLEDIEYLKAIELYKTNIIRKCYESFKIYDDKNFQNDVQQIQAISFKKLKQKQKVFQFLHKQKQEKLRLKRISYQIALTSETGSKLIVINALVQNIKNHQDNRSKNVEAQAHYGDRLIRLGLFAFKKQQLITMMQKSINIKIEERVTGEYWQAWKGVFQNRLSEKRSQQISEEKLDVPIKKRDNLLYEFPEEHKKSDISPKSQIMNDYNFDIEEMDQQINLVPQESVEGNGFNDTYGTRFSGAQVLEEMALDFDDHPEPFADFDNLKIEQNESLVSDSFENLFHQVEKKSELQKLTHVSGKKQQFSEISLLDNDEVPFYEYQSQEITDMKIVGQRTGSDYKRFKAKNDMLDNSGGSESDF